MRKEKNWRMVVCARNVEGRKKREKKEHHFEVGI